MTSAERSKLMDMISRGEIENTLDELLSIEINESNRNEVVITASRYERMQKQKRLGILSFEQSNLTENQIIAHLIELIDHIEDPEFPEEKSLDATNPTRPIIWKYVTALAVILGIIANLSAIGEFIRDTFFGGGTAEHQLTVYVTDTEGNAVLQHKGVLNTYLGNRPLRETIGANGRTNFGDILPKHVGDSFTIGFMAEGWELVDKNNRFKFDGKPISLKVKRDDSLGMIKGEVMTRDGKDFISGALVRINNDTTVLSDELGVFKILLPPYLRITNPKGNYELTVSKEGYQTANDYYFPGANIEIRLKK